MSAEKLNLPQHKMPIFKSIGVVPEEYIYETLHMALLYSNTSHL